MIVITYSSIIYYEREKLLFYKAEIMFEQELERIKSKKEYKGSEITQFTGCPAAGPYIMGSFDEKKIAVAFDNEIEALLTKFRFRIVK